MPSPIAVPRAHAARFDPAPLRVGLALLLAFACVQGQYTRSESPVGQQFCVRRIEDTTPSVSAL